MKKKILIGIILILIIGLFVFIGYRSEERYDGEIVSFEYSYGGYPDGYWYYKIYTENGKTYILAKGMNGVDLNLDKELEETVLTDISKIVKENKIYKWNGFSKKNNAISDGYTFSLTIKYNDGKEVKSYGHEKYPKNYDNIHKILSNYLDAIK